MEGGVSNCRERPFLSALLLIVLFAHPFAVHAQTKTSDEKYRELVEKAIFESGIDGDRSGYITRAKAARDIALLMGSAPYPEGAGIYHDLAGAERYVGYIGALTANGVIQGKGDGVFAPFDYITVQEFAKMLVVALDLDYDPNAVVKGADDWAAGYVQTAVQAGLIPEMDDYTQPVSIDLMIDIAYGVSERVDAGRWIRSAKPIGVRLVKVELKGGFSPDRSARRSLDDPPAPYPGGCCGNGVLRFHRPAGS